MLKSRLEHQVIFISSGLVGWNTMFSALKNNYKSRNFAHYSLDRYSAGISDGRSLRNLVPLTFRNKLDIYYWTRHKRLRFVLEKYKSYRGKIHCHCFGHSVAVPDLFKSYGATYSVSSDGTWVQSKAMQDTVNDLFPEEENLKELVFEHAGHWKRRIDSEPDIFARASFVHATSDWAKRGILEKYDVSSSKTFVAPFPIVDHLKNSLDAERCILDKPVSKHRICTPRSGMLQITFIGNDFLRKGGYRLLKWHQEILHTKYELVVISKDVLDLRDKTSYKNASFYEHVDNATVRNVVLPNTAILVLPTYLDQSPIVCIEAAAAGVPVLATNVGGINELVVDRYNGFIFDISDDLAMVDCLVYLSNRPEVLEQLSVNARSLYKSSMNSEIIYKNLNIYFRNVTEVD